MSSRGGQQPPEVEGQDSQAQKRAVSLVLRRRKVLCGPMTCAATPGNKVCDPSTPGSSTAYIHATLSPPSVPLGPPGAGALLCWAPCVSLTMHS